MKSLPGIMCLFSVLWLGGSYAAAQSFGLDEASPSLAGDLEPDDVLNRFPAGGAATLPGVGEEVDAFSFGNALSDFSSYFPPLSDIMYSVDGLAVGVSGTVIRAESVAGDQAGDIFMISQGFGTAAAKLLFDGDGSSGPSLGLAEQPTADNLDSLDMTTVPGQRIYFSVSPSALASYYPGASAADVFITSPASPGYDAVPPASVYATATQIGLVKGDDINALVVFDDGDEVFTPGTDVIVFSLAPGSPYTGTNSPGPNFPGMPITEGDLLVDAGVYGMEAPSVYLDAATFGLSALRDGGDSNDNLDAVAMVRGELGASIGPKWRQRVDCEYGLNVQSWRIEGGGVERAVFDDWLCDGRPVMSIEWQGSYQGWEGGESLPAAPPADSRPAGFSLSWFSDAGEGGHPGALLRSDYYPLAEYIALETGSVAEFSGCVIALPAGAGYEHVYSYEINFVESEWRELAGRTYWLSIEAVYTNPVPDYSWAWATALPEDGWGSPAMLATIAGTTNDITCPPPDWQSVTNHRYTGQQMTMAFSLLTDVWPARCTQVSLPPSEGQGADAASWTTVGEPQYESLWADDFVSDGRRITDIRWRGSYIHWQTNVFGGGAAPVAPPTDALAPLGFALRLYEHDGVGNGPGPPIHDLFVNLADCHETFRSSQAAGEGVYRHEYVYLVDLLDRAVAGESWAVTNEPHAWLSIQAVFPAGFQPAAHGGWCWNPAADTNGLRCVVSSDSGVTWTNGTAADLAFELGADRIPGNGTSEAVFTHMDYDPLWQELRLESEGHCGCGKQVLQRRDDLTSTSGWTDVESRVIPRPGYTWNVDGTSTQRFFRVRQHDL